MSTESRSTDQEIIYPDSDGQPMSDNTLQFEWIALVKFGLEHEFRNRADVFVAGDLLWYPVEGDPTTRIGPDVLVAIGRPKGYRGSYRQWQEGGIAPQVVFEILSPNNRQAEMLRKRAFYARHGVLEYYVYDPHENDFEVWLRDDDELMLQIPRTDWTSPRLGVRFVWNTTGLEIYSADGRRFEPVTEVMNARDEAEAAAVQLRLKANQERERAERLAARLRELGIDPGEV